MKQNKNRNKIGLLFYIFLNIILTNFFYPVKAFVPYIYTANEKILVETSLNIALTASQYIRYGQPKEGISLAKIAISLNPKEAELWIILAKAQLNNNLAEEALTSIKKAQEINPELALIWFTKASIEMQMNKIESAVKSIIKYISLDNKNANAYFLLGNARLMQNKYEIALKAFSNAEKINPKLWQATNNKGLIYYELGEKATAIHTWRKVLKIKADPEPKLALAIALNSLQPNNKESIRLAKEALEENPNYFSVQHQKEQLWGEQLRKSGVALFTNPKLKDILNTAAANSNVTNEKNEKTW